MKILVDHKKIFIGQVAKLIENREYDDIDWVFVLETYGFENVFENYRDLARPDNIAFENYKWQTRHALLDSINDNEDDALEMIHYIFNNYLEVNDDDFEKYDWLKEFLNKDIRSKPNIYSKENYLEIKNTPQEHDFYEELINLINNCYNYEIYAPVIVFSRKLLENLIIDILKKVYGSDNIDKYYITNQRRYQDFKTILENFEVIINDLNHLEPELDKKIIKNINSFKSTANSNVHSLVVNPSKTDVDDKKKKLNDLVKILIKIYGDIPSNFQISNVESTKPKKHQVRKNLSKERQEKLTDKRKIEISSKPGFNIFIGLTPSDISKEYDLSNIDYNQILLNLSPIYSYSWNHRRNFDGFLTFSGKSKEDSDSYVQLFRNGIIKALYTDKDTSETETIDITWLEKQIINNTKQYIQTLGYIEVSPPITISIIIKGVKGWIFKTDISKSIFGRKIPIDRDVLELPSVTLNNFNDRLETTLRPALDTLWNAAGYEKSMNYNENDDYIV